jgi:hypothetical protein
LIYGEQGVGDQVLFASCLYDLMPFCDAVTLAVDNVLVDLFSDSFPELKVDSISNYNEVNNQFDYCVPIGSLPKYFRNDLSDFPGQSHYLRTDPGRSEYWKQRLQELPGELKVGISWQGGLGKTRRFYRSVNLPEMLPVLNVPGIDLISLQYTDCELELQQISQSHGIRVHHWQEAIDNYAETAALVDNLDLVISVCTSVVTLAGALGKTTWVLVPASPGWMFGLEGDRCDWFDSLKLYRQSCGAGWDSVIRQIAEDLSGIT